MPDKYKPLVWIGSSKKDLMVLPMEVRKFFGHALDFAQRGDKHDSAKVLKGFGGAGVLELVEDDEGGTYVAAKFMCWLHRQLDEQGRNTCNIRT